MLYGFILTLELGILPKSKLLHLLLGDTYDLAVLWSLHSMNRKYTYKAILFVENSPKRPRDSEAVTKGKISHRFCPKRKSVSCQSLWDRFRVRNKGDFPAVPPWRRISVKEEYDGQESLNQREEGAPDTAQEPQAVFGWREDPHCSWWITWWGKRLWAVSARRHNREPVLPLEQGVSGSRKR